MFKYLSALLLFLCVATLRADQTISEAQQILKDQGFYYGQVTGEKNADTSAAIRRYQIRNGLDITGELNDETLKALRKAPAATPAPAASLAPVPPPRLTPPAQSTVPDDSDLRDDANLPNDVPPTGPGQRVLPNPQDQGSGPVYPGRAPAPRAGLFAGTPYAMAPPEIQQKVVVDAQEVLAGRGLFKHQIDGVFSPDMEFSLRAYQTRVGLRPTGRLDLDTLAALELLPGAHERVYGPRRSLPPGVQLPPVRGEWIRP
jgi:peptidoglycan hydrolase-like protein with peptidoglycan-binding domain